MKNSIIIIAGDPNSINSEILYKCWNKINSKLRKKIFIIGNFELIKTQLKKLRYSVKLKKVKGLTDTNGNKLKIINVNLNFKEVFNVDIEEISKYIKRSLTIAHKLALNKNVKGIINCPINKQIFYPKKIGVTEYLASKNNIKNDSEVMLIKSENYAVCPITTHIDLKDISKKINKEKIVKKVLTINSWFKKFKRKKPKIGILGLNPHNAELRKNSEEKKYIIPAIKKLLRLKINVKGPIVADTFFIKDYKNYDVVVGMYHDQVLSPFKSLFGFNLINITLGLQYHRLSPDHGTAKNLINKHNANALSLIKCVNFLNNIKQ